MGDTLFNLSMGLHSLSVFRSLRSDPVLRALCAYLDCVGAVPVKDAVDAYAEFVSCLYSAGTVSLSGYIQELVNNDGNCFIRCACSGQTPAPTLSASLYADLSVLQQAAGLTPEALRRPLDWEGFLPEWETQPVDLTGHYLQRVENIGRCGYGIYARHRVFYLDQSLSIVPARSPDGIRLSALVGYDREKEVILSNTKALLQGKPAANLLLTGDAGTGKSSTVKAVVNELSSQGLRILEVRKEQLYGLTSVLNALAENPLKFILFIDDLSFTKADDNFSALKAILEGSVSVKPPNVVIYATSNRRHLVRESFSDRDGDDIHFNDTVQEIMSLSQRFGLQLTFQRPDKPAYLAIVRHLADERGLTWEEDRLIAAAERFALARGTRSARTARQFIDGIAAGSLELP